MGLDRTVRMRAYAGDSKNESGNLTREQELELELTKKKAQLEEEKKKSLETLNALEHARQHYKQEQVKTAELQEKLNAAEARIQKLVVTLGKIAGIAAEAEK